MHMFEKYEISLAMLENALIGSNLAEFHVLRGRLMENISDVRLYGDTEEHRADRAKILNALNIIALATFQRPFNSLPDMPNNQGQSSENMFDIVVYVALIEEFIHVIQEFGNSFTPRELSDVALTVYCGIIHSSPGATKYRVGVIPAGKMGNTRAGNVMSAVLSSYSCANVVVLGIAGALSNDLQPGDVLIPDSVSEYLANSAAIGETDLSFVPSGNRLPTNPRLLNRLQLFSTNRKESFIRWQELATTRRASSLDPKLKLALSALEFKWDLPSKMLAGDDRILGSGPAVGKGQAFVNWLTRVDRKVVAIEMESAGVYDATFIRSPAPRVIAIRGISDYADERKEKLESLGKGLFRIAAARNATSLLVTAIEAGIFAK